MKIFVLSLSLLFWGQAHALTASFSTNFFKPTIDDSDYFTVYSSKNMNRGLYHAGFYLDYARNPYEVGNTSFSRFSGLTNTLITGNFLGSYAIYDWFTAGARLPVFFIDTINAPLLGRSDETNFNLGDAEIDLKFRLLDRDRYRVGFAAIPFVSVPTATNAASDFTGNGGVAGGVRFAVDGKPQSRVNLALNLGFEARDSVTDVSGNTIGSHLLMGFGVSVDAIKNKLKVIAETEVETVVNDFFKRRTTPGEARVGVRYSFKNGFDANVGGGFGYTRGIASPELRAMAGITYTPRIASVDISEHQRWSELSFREEGLRKGVTPDTLELKDDEEIKFDVYTLNDSTSVPAYDVYMLQESPLVVSEFTLPSHEIDLGNFLLKDPTAPQFPQVQEGDHFSFQEKVFFGKGSTGLKPGGKVMLDRVAKFMKNSPDVKKLRVEGYTCDLGSNAYNQRLSDERAQEVVDYLVKEGISRSRLKAVGYGKNRPIVPNISEANRSKNRRVQFVIEKKK